MYLLGIWMTKTQKHVSGDGNTILNVNWDETMVKGGSLYSWGC
jgi:hypothetical protein